MQLSVTEIGKTTVVQNQPYLQDSTKLDESTRFSPEPTKTVKPTTFASQIQESMTGFLHNYNNFLVRIHSTTPACKTWATNYKKKTSFLQKKYFLCSFSLWVR